MSRPKASVRDNLSIRLDPEDHQKLTELADRYQWTLSKTIEVLIRLAWEERMPLLPWERELRSSGDS